METTEAKAFRTVIRILPLFKSEWLRKNIKLTFQKALIKSTMTHACSTWEFVVQTHLLKVQQQKLHGP
jgi:hypothetical protein